MIEIIIHNIWIEQRRTKHSNLCEIENDFQCLFMVIYRYIAKCEPVTCAAILLFEIHAGDQNQN